MPSPDLNLLHTLNVLLEEKSVTRAAKNLRLSPSAMSRALARLRSVTGDQLLVRAGRSLVPTPRAEQMRDKVRHLVEDAHALLRPEDRLDLLSLERSFTLRTSDGIAETFGPELIRRLQETAPKVQLRFVRKLDKDSRGLRDGTVDFETGVVDSAMGPEVRAQALFCDRYIGVVRSGHPLAKAPVTSADFAAWSHVVTWREGLNLGGIDEQMKIQDLKRSIMTTVDGFATALALVRETDLIAVVPERHTEGLRNGTHSFAIPLPMDEFTVSLFWHPRFDGEPAHRWMRGLIKEVADTDTIAC